MKHILQKGFSTLEMLIALALVSLIVSGVTLVIFGNQSLAADSQTNTEALHMAQEELEEAIEKSRKDFGGVTNTSATVVNGITYTAQLEIPVAYKTQCSKQVISRVTWTGDHGRPQKIELASTVTNIPEMLALAGGCDISPSGKTWVPPATWASSNFNPGKPRGLAAFDRIVYEVGDKAPYLYIADTSVSTLGQSSGLFVNFANGFDDGEVLNDIVVAKASNGKMYAYVARNSNTDQFGVIEVDDIYNPKPIVRKSLTGVNPSGSQPEGFRIFYYDKKAYVVTQETSGPELHVFDVSSPWAPGTVVEVGFKELNRTVEDFVVTKKTVSGIDTFVAYMASDKNSAELSVFDVTVPSAIAEVTAANVDLSGNQDGSSLFLTNGLLYFGRLSSGGSDLYVFDVSSLSATTISGQLDLGTSVLGVVVSGQFMFIATDKTNEEFRVYKSDTLAAVSNFNFPNVITNGLIYEDDWVYVASQGNDALRIIYSPN